MRRLTATLASIALLAAVAATPASADFGLSNLEVAFTASDGSPATEAGTHPFAMSTSFDVNGKEVEGKEFVDGALKDLEITLPPGFAGNPTAVPRCETVDFLTLKGGPPTCSDSTALGLLTVEAGNFGLKTKETVAIYNLRPSPGVAQKLGFTIQEVPITVNAFASPTPPYNITASLANTTQAVEVFSSTTTLWGNPADPVHDPDRGRCGYSFIVGSCPAGIAVRPFITLPRSCDGPLSTVFEATSWWSGEPKSPGQSAFFKDVSQTAEMTNCAALGFAPEMQAAPTTDQAESPTGFDVDFEIADEGLANPTGTAHSDIRKAVVTLPEGMTANPSLAEGLAACSPADLARESVNSAPGQGCPQASKVGSVQAETPLLEGTILKGALYIATQDDPSTPQPGAENPFDSLLALYMVIKNPELGLIFKLPGKIEPDPQTGQLVTTFDDLPPYPVASFEAHLREGGRSPLISPPACGTYAVKAELTPSGDPANPLTTSSSFQITRGVGGSPCPSGPQPFGPGFEAGTLNNDAGAHSPFYMRLTRRDGDQDLTRFDAELPPGVVAKLAGVSECSDAAIAAAKAKRGRQELASPSCPANSKIGTVFGGAGVGSQLTYVPGSLYLAGPFGGGPLSVVGIVPAVAGPFDVGTVVVRQALKVDPRSGEVTVDGANSDPIPHILAGIPLRVRDIRVHVDRPQFTLNPTSCNPFATVAQIWGGGVNLFSSADDSPTSVSSRFQASNCSRLGFKPRLALKLKGGTKRGGHPALTGTFKPRPGDANLAGMVLRLPRSAFLDQAHIRTICTRVQYAAGGGNGGGCPTASIYGQATAFTPLLSEPLKGPVYLRSSDNNLPDFVASLHGLVDVEAVARIDSIKGGIRATFEGVPDAPLSKVVVRMQGAKKGLIVNSTDLCAAKNRANAQLSGQNAKRRAVKPVVKASCAKRRAKK